MKKVILSALVVGSLLATSCKKAKEDATNATEQVTEAAEQAADKVTEAAEEVAEGAEEAVNNATEAVQSALEGVTIPSFDNEKVEQHLKDYAAYAKEYIDAKGDVIKNTELAKKGVELANQGAELVKTLDEEAAKKFNSVMNAIQSKMAPAK